MQALLFLTTRSMFNGFRRAVTSGRRIFTLLFAVAYYAFLVFRPMGSSRRYSDGAPQFGNLTPEIVDCVIFGLFSVLSFFLMLSILSPRGGFRQSDVDVLFPTPVSPRLVMVFRMLRDYLFTLLTPLMLMLFGGRASWMAFQSFLAGMHSNAALTGRMTAAAWFLMSFTWVSIGYGLGFFVNRSDLQADKNKKLLDRVIFCLVMGTVLYFLVRLKLDLSWSTVLSCAQSPLIRAVFFSATAATWMVTGVLHNDFKIVALGVGVLGVVSYLGIRLALSQLPYMYDQAAVKGFGTAELRVMRRNNDIYGLMAQQAREGKFKVGKFSRWIGRMRLSGASALIWKEVLLQMRGARFLYFLFGPIQILMTVAPAFTMSGNESRPALRIAGVMVILMEAASVLMLTMNTAISGFTELLKRVDFQKPLPFRPSGTVFWEVASKCIPNLLFAIIASVAILFVRPILWGYALGSMVFVLGFSLLVSGTVFLVTIAFPDAGDASQRGFRGILILLGLIILGSPGGALLVFLLTQTQLNPALAAIPSSIICVGITVIVCIFAGGLYDSYNPSE